MRKIPWFIFIRFRISNLELGIKRPHSYFSAEFILGFLTSLHVQNFSFVTLLLITETIARRA